MYDWSVLKMKECSARAQIERRLSSPKKAAAPVPSAAHAAGEAGEARERSGRNKEWVDEQKRLIKI